MQKGSCYVSFFIAASFLWVTDNACDFRRLYAELPAGPMPRQSPELQRQHQRDFEIAT
jgi:hypothetical protein